MDFSRTVGDFISVHNTTSFQSEMIRLCKCISHINKCQPCNCARGSVRKHADHDS